MLEQLLLLFKHLLVVYGNGIVFINLIKRNAVFILGELLAY